MKTTVTPTGLRMVGKAYEIRWMLRRMVGTAADPKKPLASGLQEIAPHPHTSRVIPFPNGR